VVGIINGIDDAAWDPRTDPALPARFAIGDLAGKAQCRAALADEYGLRVDATTPIAAAIARLTPQKGIDLIAEQAAAMIARGVRWIVLGAGDRGLEDRLRGLAAAYPGQFAVHTGFDPDRARRIYGGADLFVMPSRFEPCGLASSTPCATAPCRWWPRSAAWPTR
jgi:starch synthase